MPRGRPKKYNTREEILAARRIAQRKYQLKNKKITNEKSKLCMRKKREKLKSKTLI